MAQLTPSFATLVAAFSDCFHPQVFQTFQALLAGWITCQGPRTISEAWLATGLAAKRHHDTAHAVFHSACWEWDDLGIVTATLILTHLVPGGVAWVVVDDTLCCSAYLFRLLWRGKCYCGRIQQISLFIWPT